MKRNGIMIALVAIAMITGFSSCEKTVGEGPVVTQSRTIENFRALSVGISGRVNWLIGPVFKVELQAQQNILDIIETNLQGDELVIKFRNGSQVGHHQQIVVNITSPHARSVNLGGSAEVDLSGELVETDLALRVNGSGNILVGEAEIANKISATVTGSGNIHVLSGSAFLEDLRISGSGNIDLTGVSAEEAEADISGSGNMRVNLSDKLNATISGSGSVFYKGNPVVNSTVSGSGSVRQF